MKQYSITIYRNKDDEVEEVFDSYITADQAIDALLYVQGLVPEEVEVEEEQTDAEALPEEDTPAPAPAAVGRKPGNKYTSRTEYDKEALTAEIKEGKISNADLVVKYGVTVATIYQIKHKMKHADPTSVADDAPPATAYIVRQKEREAVPTPATNVEWEIYLAALQGFSLSKISDMYPTVPLETITSIRNEAKKK